MTSKELGELALEVAKKMGARGVVITGVVGEGHLVYVTTLNPFETRGIVDCTMQLVRNPITPESATVARGEVH